MFIFNASFMMEKEMESEFLSRFNAGDGRVSRLREAGGEDASLSDVQTVAVQWEFETLEAARNWGRNGFRRMACECDNKFGEGRVMVFTSIFETWT